MASVPPPSSQVSGFVLVEGALRTCTLTEADGKNLKAVISGDQPSPLDLKKMQAITHWSQYLRIQLGACSLSPPSQCGSLGG